MQNVPKEGTGKVAMLYLDRPVTHPRTNQGKRCLTNMNGMAWQTTSP